MYFYCRCKINVIIQGLCKSQVSFKILVFLLKIYMLKIIKLILWYLSLLEEEAKTFGPCLTNDAPTLKRAKIIKLHTNWKDIIKDKCDKIYNRLCSSAQQKIIKKIVMDWLDTGHHDHLEHVIIKRDEFKIEGTSHSSTNLPKSLHPTQ